MLRVELNPESGSQCRSTVKTRLIELDGKELYTSQKPFDFLGVQINHNCVFKIKNEANISSLEDARLRRYCS